MKKVLEELFVTVQDFRETVPGIDSQVNFADLNSSAVSAKKMVVNIITAAVYREIVSGGETDALSYPVSYTHLFMPTVKERISVPLFGKPGSSSPSVVSG